MERVHPLQRFEATAWTSRAWEKFAGGNAAAYFFAWLICIAVLAVSLVIFWASFNPGRPFELRLGLDNYIKTLDSALFTQVIPNTILVGLGTVITVLIFWLPAGMVAQSDQHAHAGFLHQSDSGQCDCSWFG